MRQTLFLLLAGVLLAVVALGSDSPKEYDDKVRVDLLEGTWILTEQEYDGKKMKPNHELKHIYHSGTFRMDNGGGNPWRGSYLCDTAHKPCHLDTYPLNGPFKEQNLKFIYQIEGDVLRIAFMPPNDWRRPQGFNGKNIFVETYKRVKK